MSLQPSRKPCGLRSNASFPSRCRQPPRWHVLQDVHSITPCMPGARLIGRLGADRHLARMAARIGPARVSFEGEMAITSCDAARMQIDMDARGIDRRRHTAATMHLTARIHSCDAGRCELVGRAVFRVYGRLAALGGILLRRVGDQLVSDFGDHFAARACAMERGARTSPPHCAELDGLALVWRMLMQRRRAQRRIDEHR